MSEERFEYQIVGENTLGEKYVHGSPSFNGGERSPHRQPTRQLRIQPLGESRTPPGPSRRLGRRGRPTGDETQWLRGREIVASFPIKLDDDRTLRGTGPNGESVVFDDHLYEGDFVGIGQRAEDDWDQDPLPPYGNVVLKDDGLWIVERTDEEEAERTRQLLDRYPADHQEGEHRG